VLEAAALRRQTRLAEGRKFPEGHASGLRCFLSVGSCDGILKQPLGEERRSCGRGAAGCLVDERGLELIEYRSSLVVLPAEPKCTKGASCEADHRRESSPERRSLRLVDQEPEELALEVKQDVVTKALRQSPWWRFTCPLVAQTPAWRRKDEAVATLFPGRGAGDRAAVSSDIKLAIATLAHRAGAGIAGRVPQPVESRRSHLRTPHSAERKELIGPRRCAHAGAVVDLRCEIEREIGDVPKTVAIDEGGERFPCDSLCWTALWSSGRAKWYTQSMSPVPRASVASREGRGSAVTTATWGDAPLR